jgi:hypothetical protein
MLTYHRVDYLQKKIQTKDEVLAELMAEHIALKKALGNSDRRLGSARYARSDRGFRPELVTEDRDRRRAIHRVACRVKKGDKPFSVVGDTW